MTCGLVGVRRIRAGDVLAHRRMMLSLTALVMLFLVSYVFKLMALGREDRSAWSQADFATLYLHESCIAVLLLAGGYALIRAWRFRASLAADAPNPLPAEVQAERAQHRLGGRVAVVAAVLAFLTAAVVLADMYSRAGL